MKIGERVTFPFGKGEMEGVVKRVFEKTVYITADFPRHKGKIVRRSISDLSKGKTKSSKAKSRKTQ
ncbi:MAG: hypothetical protein JRH07_09620 [Deltaproteobacteria bacterium]|nr:hypothetical protein [Deltaproteobacteria bacterium]MBW2122091.1 hypothetical protein [Deltaproteobacteria bacterium]